MSKRFQLAVLTLVALLSLNLAVAVTPSQAASGSSQFFAPTGFAVSGQFLDYWNAHGGLSTFGYPITGAYYEQDPISGKSYLTQWFERNRFELHPENAGTPYEVLLGLLGRQLTSSRTGEAPFQTVSNPNTSGTAYFSQTGHTLSGTFRTYWETTGGLSLYGYPISEPFSEKNPSDGKTYTVQYFERNRFELHPENAAPYNVLLGLLGQQLKQAAITPVINHRTNPLDLINSYYNAINLGDYHRAYSYWQRPGSTQSSNPQSYTDFANGFAQTSSVGISTGPITSDGTAGTVFTQVPAVIISTQKNGTQQRFYGCYRIAQIDVQINDLPLPNPEYIPFAKVFAAPASADLNTLMKQAQALITDTNPCAS